MSALGSLFGRSSGSALPYSPTSPEGLVARWVRWVAAHREPANPIKDGSGRHAGHHQPEDVWFLAGTFGGGVARNCTVPAGRPLFFPAFNVWQTRAKPGELPVISNATGHAQLDGVPLSLASIGTPTPFTVRGFLNNVVTALPVPIPVSCWGLWASVPPPAPGTHELTFGGSDGGRFWVEAQYRLTVR